MAATKKGSDAVNEGLLRQRRNLMTVCILLWLLKYGQVEFSKLSFAGFDVTFNRPEALYLCLWAAFAYFLYRYYQYFVRYGQSEVTSHFKNGLDQSALDWMAKIHRAHPEWDTKIGYPKLGDLFRSRFIVRAEERIMEQGQDKGGRPFEVRLNRWHVLWRLIRVVGEGVLRSTVVTDYLLPFVLALSVLLYCGGGEWQGGFWRLIF